MITDTLIDKILELNNPTVAGLDPNMSFVPAFIKNETFEKYGQTLKGAAEAFLTFNKMIIDQIYDIVPCVKPQVAMYEQYGAEGMQAYIDTIAYAKEKGLVVIGDIKRGDIASTAEAYSNGHIGEVTVGEGRISPYKEDFITINPYLGFDSVEPYISNCERFEKGLFILVKTSNPNSGEIQDLVCGGEKIYEHVGKLVSKWGEGLIGKHGYSALGAVVGATHPGDAEALRKQMPHTFFLVPGYGAQGGTAQDLKVCFTKGLGAIVNSSRGIIGAYKLDKYKQNFSEKEFAHAARQACLDMKQDLQICMG